MVSRWAFLSPQGLKPNLGLCENGMCHEHDWTGCPQGRHPSLDGLRAIQSRLSWQDMQSKSAPIRLPLAPCVCTQIWEYAPFLSSLDFSSLPSTQRALSVRQYLTEKFLHSSCVENPPGLLLFVGCVRRSKYLRCYARPSWFVVRLTDTVDLPIGRGMACHLWSL